MGMSKHIIGFRPPDDKWRQMKTIWDACQNAGIKPPEEVSDFFNGEQPDNAGVEVEIPQHEWNDEYRWGLEVHLDELPNGVKTIRFYNSV